MTSVVLAMTGASGVVYGVRLLHVLLAAGRDVHLCLSPAAVEVMQAELGLAPDLQDFQLEQLLPDPDRIGEDSRRALLRPQADDSQQHAGGRAVYHHFQDYQAGIASGSFPTDGMVICPCSMGTLGSLAGGLSSNLIHRAAHVHLKERRKLVLVPRETPLSTIHLQNMMRLSEAGAVILPAMPGWYHQPQSMHDLVDFIVARICDQLGVPAELTRRWSIDSP